MDGSKRSGHGNAYFTGFGRARRIVFFDTLLARLVPDGDRGDPRARARPLQAAPRGQAHRVVGAVLARVPRAARVARHQRLVLRGPRHSRRACSPPRGAARRRARAVPARPAGVHVHAVAAGRALFAPARIRGRRIRRAQRLGRRAGQRAGQALRGQRVDAHARSRCTRRSTIRIRRPPSASPGSSQIVRRAAHERRRATRPSTRACWRLAAMRCRPNAPRLGADELAGHAPRWRDGMPTVTVSRGLHLRPITTTTIAFVNAVAWIAAPRGPPPRPRVGVQPLRDDVVHALGGWHDAQRRRSALPRSSACSPERDVRRETGVSSDRRRRGAPRTSSSLRFAATTSSSSATASAWTAC